MPIRQAVSNDFPSVHNLIQELAIFEKAPDQVIAHSETLRNACESNPPLAWCWVATNENDFVIGAAVCYVRYSTWKGPVFYLEDLIVTESYRRQGIGKQLLNAIVEFAQQSGYKRVQWQVLDWNQSALDFYKKFNVKFDDEWINVHIEFQ